MILSALIIAVSTALFLYWFRYSCVLILSTKTTRDYTEEVAAANQLGFIGAVDKLDVTGQHELEAVRRSLERDFQVVNNLLAKVSGLPEGTDALEEMMLRIDFRIMSAWFSLTRRFSDSTARSALDEMSQIVAHFANTCGERETESVRA